MSVLDTGGHESCEASLDRWIQGGKVFIVVYSIDLLQSYWRAMEIAARVRRNKPAAPIILVVNKHDMGERNVSVTEGGALGLGLRCKYVETSAKNGTGLRELWDHILELYEWVSQPSSPSLLTKELIDFASQHCISQDLLLPVASQPDLRNVFSSQRQILELCNVRAPVAQEGNELAEELLNDSVERSGEGSSSRNYISDRRTQSNWMTWDDERTGLRRFLPPFRWKKTR